MRNQALRNRVLWNCLKMAGKLLPGYEESMQRVDRSELTPQEKKFFEPYYRYGSGYHYGPGFYFENGVPVLIIDMD